MGMGEGGNRAVVLLFLCEANSEKVLYCDVPTWSLLVGLLKWDFMWYYKGEVEDWLLLKGQATQMTKILIFQLISSGIPACTL